MTIYSQTPGFISLATENGNEFHVGNVVGLHGTGIVFLEAFTKNDLTGKVKVRDEILIDSRDIKLAVMAKYSSVRNFFLCLSICALLAGFNLWAYEEGRIYWFGVVAMFAFAIGAVLSPLVGRPKVTFTTHDEREFKWIGEFLCIFDNRDWAKHIKNFCNKNGIAMDDRYYGGKL